MKTLRMTLDAAALVFSSLAFASTWEIDPSHSTLLFSIFFFNDTAATEIYTLSLHDALPISANHDDAVFSEPETFDIDRPNARSEEHTSELQSRRELVCRLLLEKKKKIQ